MLADVTVEQLAAKLDTPGLGAKTIGAIERGERAVRPHELRVLAEALDVPIEFFSAEFSYGAGTADQDRAEYLRRFDHLEDVVDRLDQWESAPVWRRVLDTLVARIDGVSEQIREISESQAKLATRVAALEPVIQSRSDAAAEATRLAAEAARRHDEREQRTGEAPGRPGARRGSG